MRPVILGFAFAVWAWLIAGWVRDVVSHIRWRRARRYEWEGEG